MRMLHPFFRRNRTTTSAAVAAAAAAATVTKSLAVVAFGGASSALSASSSNSSLRCSPSVRFVCAALPAFGVGGEEAGLPRPRRAMIPQRNSWRHRQDGAPVSSSSPISLFSRRFSSSPSVLKAQVSDDDPNQQQQADHEQQQQQQQHLKSYQLTGIGAGTHVQIETTETGHRIQTDLPKALGGHDTAPQPVELLLSSWMGCTQATAMYVSRQILRRRRQQHKQEPIKNRTGRHNSNNDNNNTPTIQLDTIVFENIVAHRDERGALQLPIQERPRIPSQVFSITGTIRVYFKTTRPASFSTTITPVVSDDGGKDSAPDPHGENKQSSSSTAVSSSSSLLLTEKEFEVFQEQVEVRCPIANMIITSGCKINVDWIQMKSTP